MRATCCNYLHRPPKCDESIFHEENRCASPAVLQYVICHWAKYCFEAKCSAGLSTCPDKPHVGFLLAHHYVAVNLMNDSVQSIAKPMATISMVEVIKVKKQESAPVEEVLAMIAAMG